MADSLILQINSTVKLTSIFFFYLKFSVGPGKIFQSDDDVFPDKGSVGWRF